MTKLCRSPYCECQPGQCSHPGFHDARHIPVCKAVQHSDQMVCHDCKSAWDVNDPDPPECLPNDEFIEMEQAAQSSLDSLED